MFGIEHALWNTLLLIVPTIILSFLQLIFHSKKWEEFVVSEKITFPVLFGLAVLFFPNIPYVFTDIRHVLDYCEPGDEFNRCMRSPWIIPSLFTFSALGIIAFVITIDMMKKILGTVFSKRLNPLVPIVIMPLSSLGICVGLFERLNSWDVFLHPTETLTVLMSYFTDLGRFTFFFVLTVSLFILYYSFSITFSRWYRKT